ncbi:cell wall-active antibiotics response protein LiaF [Paenibacillus sp. 481]|uniref:cell wall-active antibiotics response protein LiaF n=1 Tax=Paenibacillus sp. 481 TaxID=2835869 RepID=UPI001E335E87|nr:cell wall-active antibiotics response protein LiaF [Paenibacillus sp. 481]UHA72347.1 cell wall-active antibiotics response protein [Paenibacillus sp. 481]
MVKGTRWLGGLGLIMLGIFFMLKQLNIIDIELADLFRTFWPVFLLVYGCYMLVKRVWWSILVLIIGAYLLLRNLGLVTYSLGDIIPFLLPVGLVALGISFLLKPKNNTDFSVSPYPNVYKDDMGMHDVYGNPEMAADNWMKDNPYTTPPIKLKKSSFLGNIQLGKEYWELKPLDVSQFIGDTIIDLTRAQIPYGKTDINISSFIGDVKVFLPYDMDLGLNITTSAVIGEVNVLGEKKEGIGNTGSMTTPHFYETGKKIHISINTLIGTVKVTRVG